MWRQIERIRLRAIWSWEGFVHVAKTEGSLHQWLWANAASVTLAFLLPLTAVERAVILMGGIVILAAECFNTAIERIVDDIGEHRRPRAKQAKDAGSAGVAVTAVAVGVAWVCILIGHAV